MQWIIVRHGVAVDIGERGVQCDADRMLSDEGRKRTRQAARGLRALGVRPGRLLTSPLVRARETAVIFGEELAPDLAIEEDDVLAPGAYPDEVMKAVQGGYSECCMTFGHMPDCGDLIAAAVCGMPTGGFPVKKAGAASIQFASRVAAGRGLLEWLVTPRVMRSLAHD